MIVDTCLYAGEADMLRLRLETLDPIVDLFVICEADLTHQGFDKPLAQPRSDPAFAPWHAKMQPVYATDLARLYTEDTGPDSICDGCGHYLRGHSSSHGCGMLTEGGCCPCGRNLTPVRGVASFRLDTQRRAIDRLRADGRVAPDAVVLVSDVDEIPDVATVEQLAATVATDTVAAAVMSYRFLAVDYVHPDVVCVGTVATHAESLDTVRLRADAVTYPAVEGGWHLSWVGTPEERTEKLDRNANAVDLNVDPNACYEHGLDFTDTPLDPVASPPIVVASTEDFPAEWYAP